jgi:hypothetical protein
MAAQVSYYNIGDINPNPIAISSGLSLDEFVEDIMGVKDISNVKILLNGVVSTSLDDELEDGDVIRIEAKKTDSGQ